jgi:hypothetical protein
MQHTQRSQRLTGEHAQDLIAPLSLHCLLICNVLMSNVHAQILATDTSL